MPPYAALVLCGLLGVATAEDSAPPPLLRRLWGFTSPVELEAFQARAEALVVNSSKLPADATRSQIITILDDADALAKDADQITDKYWPALDHQAGFEPMKEYYGRIQALVQCEPSDFSVQLGAHVHDLYAFVLNLQRNVRHVEKILAANLDVAQVLQKVQQVAAHGEEQLRGGRRLAEASAQARAEAAADAEAKEEPASRLFGVFTSDFETYVLHFERWHAKAEQY